MLQDIKLLMVVMALPSVAKAVVQNRVLQEEVFLQLLNYLVDEECRML